MGVFFICVLLVVIGVYLLPRYIKFRGSNYRVASGNSFIKTLYDTGIYGEFLTFTYLEKLKVHYKLMTNLYIPKSDGTTTEIDLIMLSESGIYVFESKNYSGWIFGDEKSRNWMQTLPNKQKHRFFNPIWQNNGHINALISVLGLENANLCKSYIIFSERCTLKKINVITPSVKVIKRNTLLREIKKDIKNSPNLLTKEEVEGLFLQLQEYTHADIAVKRSHVDNLKRKI